jgi:hypothetical protein
MGTRCSALSVLFIWGTAAFSESPACDLDLAVRPEYGAVDGTVEITVPQEMIRNERIYLRLELNSGEG